MEKEIITLQQDNGSDRLCIRFRKHDIELLEQDIKAITKWRTPTNKYSSIYARFIGQGSVMYDYIISELNKRGWS